MNEVKDFSVSLKQNFDLNYFSTIIYNNFEVGITYYLLVEFIYNKSVLNSLVLDKPVVFKISDTNSKKSIDKLYYFFY